MPQDLDHVGPQLKPIDDRFGQSVDLAWVAIGPPLQDSLVHIADDVLQLLHRGHQTGIILTQTFSFFRIRRKETAMEDEYITRKLGVAVVVDAPSSTQHTAQ